MGLGLELRVGGAGVGSYSLYPGPQSLVLQCPTVPLSLPQALLNQSLSLSPYGNAVGWKGVLAVLGEGWRGGLGIDVVVPKGRMVT